MQKWDYQTLETTVDAAEIDAILKKAGDTGWEIMTIITTNVHGYPTTKCILIVMKRPKP